MKRTGERDVRLRGGTTLVNRSPPLKRLNTKSSPTTNKRLNTKSKSSPTASRDDKEPSTSHNMSKVTNLLERVEETDTAGEDEDEEGGGTEEEEVEEEEDTAGEEEDEDTDKVAVDSNQEEVNLEEVDFIMA